MAAWASSGLPNHNRNEKFNEEFVSQYNYTASKEDELSLTVGMRLLVENKDNDGWWFGKTLSGPPMSGWFPSTYVKKSSTANFSPPASTLSQQTDKIMVARSLYAYAGRYPEELTIEQFELLDIIEDPPNEPEWWLARNAEGKTGLVPKNYVEKQADGPIIPSNYDRVTPLRNNDQPIPLPANSAPVAAIPRGNAGYGGGIPKDVPLAQKPWFFGDMTRVDSEKTLESRASIGEFLVRNSSQRGEMCISVKAPSKIRHFKVSVKPGGQFKIGQREFESIDSLFEYYTKAPIYTNENEKLYLSRSLCR